MAAGTAFGGIRCSSPRRATPTHQRNLNAPASKELRGHASLCHAAGWSRGVVCGRLSGAGSAVADRQDIRFFGQLRGNTDRRVIQPYAQLALAITLIIAMLWTG